MPGLVDGAARHTTHAGAASAGRGARTPSTSASWAAQRTRASGAQPAHNRGETCARVLRRTHTAHVPGPRATTWCVQCEAHAVKDATARSGSALACGTNKQNTFGNPLAAPRAGLQSPREVVTQRKTKEQAGAGDRFLATRATVPYYLAYHGGSMDPAGSLSAFNATPRSLADSCVAVPRSLPTPMPVAGSWKCT